MVKIINLTTHPFNYPITFETTGIIVRALSQDTNGPAAVNGVDVKEKYNEIVFMLHGKHGIRT